MHEFALRMQILTWQSENCHCRLVLGKTFQPVLRTLDWDCVSTRDFLLP